MRFQGRITDWKDDRGFGFIVPNGGGPKVFLHFRAMRAGEGRPTGGELVTYEAVDVPGKGPRAESVAYVERKRPGKIHEPADQGGSWTGKVMAAVVLVAVLAAAWYAATHYTPKSRGNWQAEPVAEPPPSTARPRSLSEQIAPGSGAYRCDGRTMCSQMTSCDEAKYFLKNCPGVQMDGDGDGIPCERQWCK